MRALLRAESLTKRPRVSGGGLVIPERYASAATQRRRRMRVPSRANDACVGWCPVSLTAITKQYRFVSLCANNPFTRDFMTSSKTRQYRQVMADDDHGVLIIGAGHAGAATAERLRAEGYTGSVVIVGSEMSLPYQRPLLSKDWLAGRVGDSEIGLRTPEYWDRAGIKLMLGARATGIDRRAHAVMLESGEPVKYWKLVLATGAAPRTLGSVVSADADALTLRTLSDAARLRRRIVPGRRLIVVGAGFLGLEVAATARTAGMDVDVIEIEERVLSRVASPALAARVFATHCAHGVNFHFGSGVESIQSSWGRGLAVTLRNGTVVLGDSVLVAIGVVPRIELARAAGLACAGGVRVDPDGQTSDPDILAVGDVSLRPVRGSSVPLVLESVPSAAELAARAAARIVGSDRSPSLRVPWFWSHQFDLTLQIAGIRCDVAEAVLHEDRDAPGVAIFHKDATGRLVAVEALNAPRAFGSGRRMIESDASPDPSELHALL